MFTSTVEIVKLFVDIKGVGEWTMQMYLIFALGRFDVLAPNDLGVRKGIMKLYGLKEMPTPTQVKNLAEKWHPLETVGTVLYWREKEENHSLMPSTLISSEENEHHPTSPNV